jgi:hypothetical protein
MDHEIRPAATDEEIRKSDNCVIRENYKKNSIEHDSNKTVMVGVDKE